MDKPQSDSSPNPEGVTRLANKYRRSWQQASEGQRQTLCNQLGLIYTSVNDETLLKEVAVLQQSRYRRRKETSQEERNKLIKIS